MTTTSASMTAETDSRDVDFEAMLTCVDVRKSFGRLQAVDGVSFRIGRSETYGLLGPNGAGKTTIISMVAGVMAADSGRIVLDGQPMDPRALHAKAFIGYVPQEVALYPDLSARENLRFFASLYRIDRKSAGRRVADILEIVGLTDRADDKVKEYSGGMKRRLNIAVGLIHRPHLLILDEPTVGVDPQSRNAILDSIERLSSSGMAVLYTTHYMEEAERLCDRVGIIDLGRLIAEGAPAELTSQLGEPEHIQLAMEGDLDRAVTAIGDLDVAARVIRTEGSIDVLVGDATHALPGVMTAATSSGAPVRSVTVQQPDLETVFLQLTGKRLRD